MDSILKIADEMRNALFISAKCASVDVAANDVGGWEDRLRALAKQGPVAHVARDSGSLDAQPMLIWLGSMPPVGTNLYASPPPQPSLVSKLEELVAKWRADVDQIGVHPHLVDIAIARKTDADEISAILKDTAP